MNWNSDKAADSLKFFSDLGHRQMIAGYYDGPIERTREWLRKAKPVPGVRGVMFTTWHADYSKLEAFAEMLSSEGW